MQHRKLAAVAGTVALLGLTLSTIRCGIRLMVDLMDAAQDAVEDAMEGAAEEGIALTTADIAQEALRRLATNKHQERHPGSPPPPAGFDSATMREAYRKVTSQLEPFLRTHNERMNALRLRVHDEETRISGERDS